MDKYISIRQILDNLLVHPLLRDLSLERVVNYTVDFIRIVGMPRLFEEKVAILNIKNYRALLPCDYYQMIQVRKHKTNESFRYSTDSYHLGNHQGSLDNTYKIQGNIIYTSLKDGELEVAYEALAVDEEGYPVLPDNSSFTRALELYIKKQWFTIQFDLGKITAAVLQNVQQEYSWAVGQCQSDLVRPTIDQMESIANSWNTLIPRTSEHSRGFATNGSKQTIKIH